MDTKQAIVKNWIYRYTGVEPKAFGDRILLTNLPRDLHELCPMPSSLAIRLIWSKLVSSENKLHVKATASGKVGESLPTPVEMVVASLTADSGYLAYAIRQAIEAQALLEYFAEVLGYCDYDV